MYYIDTKMEAVPKGEGWANMSSDGCTRMAEYNSMTASGSVIDLSARTTVLGGQPNNPILTAEEAQEIGNLHNMFGDWDPTLLTEQAPVPTNVKQEGYHLVWDNSNYALLWAIVKNGNVIDFTTEPVYTVDDADASYAVRAANEMGGLSEAAEAISYTGQTAVVTVADAGYATFYDSESAYKVPETLKAYVVTAATVDALTFAEVQDVIPAGTAVMLESLEKAGGNYELPAVSSKATYDGVNMLMGSDVATTTTAEGQNLFYKLAYGKSGSAEANTFGWFWGADNGAAFQIEGHRAWLAIPQPQASKVGYIIGSNDATGIALQTAAREDNGAFYNLQGQRVASPTKGLYIHNNKKVIIK